MAVFHHPAPGARSAAEGPVLPLVRRRRLVGVDAARGLALAVGAWLVHWVLVLRSGGWDQLMTSAPWLSEDRIDEIIVGWPDPVLPDTSWWLLLIPGPHTNTPVAILQDLGSGAAVVHGAPVRPDELHARPDRSRGLGRVYSTVSVPVMSGW